MFSKYIIFLLFIVWIVHFWKLFKKVAA